MTDTGQVPGEGLPESAGMVEQPGAPAAHGTYTYLSETTAEDEDLLLPGSQGAWGTEVVPPTPEPVVEAMHEPGAHEMSGRDSGSVDLSAVRLPAPSAPIPPITPRRPLHLGPLIPDASASPVRSLADRGAVAAPARQPGPEYLDAPQHHEASAPQPASAWGTAAQAPAPVSTEVPAAETVVPAGQQAAAVQVAMEGGAEAGAVQVAEAGAPAPQEGVSATQEPSGDDAASAAEPGSVAGEGVAQAADEVAGAAFAPGSDEVAAAPVPEADQVVAVVSDAGVAVVDAADSGADEVAAPAVALDTAAEDVPVSEADAGAGQAQADLAADAAVDGVAQLAEAPVADAGHGSEMPAAEAVQLPEQAAPEAVQLPEQAAPEAVQLPEQAAPEAAPLPERTVPEAALPPEAPAPEGAPIPGVPAPEAVQVPEAPAPEAAPLLDAPAPEAPAQVVEPATPEAAQFPEAGQFPDAPQAPEAPEAAAPVDPQPAPDAVPAAAALDTAQQAEPASAEHLAPFVQPTDAVTVPTDDASAAVTPDPAPQLADAEQAFQQQPPQHAALPDVEAEAQAVAVTARAVDGEVPVADPAAVAAPAAQFPDAQQAPDVTAEPAVAPQPLAAVSAEAEAEAEAAQQPAAVPQPAAAQPDPAEAPEPFVAEPAGPQLRSVAVQPAQGTEHPAQSPLEPTASGEGEAPAFVPAGIAQEPAPDQPLGQFVPVEGSVPTTPHLAPTPPQPIVLPTQEAPAPVAAVPAPRDGDPELVQLAEDLDTRAADQEDPGEESTASVEEAPQPTGPAAPAYDDAEREAVLKVMRERRDIRNGFRSDPIPHEVLLRVLEAAHTAPSVGHSQPWDFVVIRSADTRRTMHELAMRQREAYAKSLPKGRAKQFKELKIEAILDTPVNIVVTADPTRGGRHTLGRHTQPQMAPYSAALAVENLWLAARAEGLGVGWVSFFDEREMVRALGLPEHLEVIAYLCVGYVDEFPDEPELLQAGWSKRRPLSWVVHEETYGRRALPGEEPHDLLAETVAQIRPLDAKALGEAWERQKRMTKPAGALGMLEIISAQLSGLSRQCPPPIPEPAAVAIFAGDHGVHAQGVTPWPQEVTAQMVANFLGGGAVCNAFAGQVGAEVCVVDVGVAADLPATPGLLPRKVRAGTSDMTTGPAMSREEAKQAIEVGIETARDLVAAGNKALLTGEMGIANTTASAALISVYTGADPAEVTGRGTGINDETLARKTEVVRRALDVHQPDPADPIGVLAAIGGFEHAALVGLLLGGASLRTPVILDGVSAGAAALVARAIAPEVLAACIAGHRSAEPGHVAALNKLGLRPLVDLDLRLGEGTGALLALPLVQSTARAMHEVATFDSAGVTEK
ncbi:nicotinate-nucleotide--dimethylbenzimidazole phosphoribosyltransferase [Streptomyces sp. NBC_01017]|uniref:nicotinate-nucleotide--dimethylbenzimidazole phosphoribosyltransferase n=1 Tax=Streptomyces sp. NBC_01017 TaxID=2903721 RepID=UPI00386CD29A|nr:nicotinate-nucleotide--dimethylbenzimidazole phosphoribosyltransferase [Streptomyces sp. NBC_01017]